MSKHKPSESNLNSWLTIISVIAAILSGFAAIYSNIQSSRSLTQSDQANEIALTANALAQDANATAKEQLKPNISVSYQFTYPRYEDEHGDPCLLDTGASHWKIDYLLAFDITNSGGQATSLVSLNNVKSFTINTFHPGIDASNYLMYFNSVDEIRAWQSEKQGPLGILDAQSIGRFTILGPPITVDPGETIRLVLHGKVEVYSDAEFDNQKLHDFIRSHGDWVIPLHFEFGNGTTKDETAVIPRPYGYYWEPSVGIIMTPFVACTQN